VISKQDPLWVYLNGQLVTEREATVSIYDRGFLYGDGVFETLRAYGGKIFKVREHIKRLFQSAKTIALTLSVSPDEIMKILSQILNANKQRDAYLRITISRGIGEIGLEPRQTTPATVVVVSKPFSGHPENLYQEGVAISMVKTQKIPGASLPPTLKSLNYLTHILAKIEARASRAYEGILLNSTGHLCEGTVSNLFFVKDGQLLTPAPSCGILEGITRQTVLKLAHKAGITIHEGGFYPEEMLSADECFITNTTMELMPVVKMNGLSARQGENIIGKGKVGAMTCKLQEAYRQLVIQGEESSQI